MIASDAGIVINVDIASLEEFVQSHRFKMSQPDLTEGADANKQTKNCKAGTRLPPVATW